MTKSKKTQTIEKPIWLKYSEEEIKAIILKLADKGLSSEKIGLILRDQYGIPNTKLYGFKIGKVLKESNKFEEPTKANLKRKLDNLSKHFKKNNHDTSAGRSLIITKSKLRKQEQYQEKKRKNDRKSN
jgi:small subunit ribosomal protein S15